ncbi:MAG: YkgJ family cysteine cluster protein [Desulfobulbaceae bacterium]|nr:YkgJ family cysteine cluster protein [Desulfobulbaceae bacterium]HIJ78428.1 YkgJ family cysteine cluster protein [Deltaproteobacteria bacterium]
MQTKITECQRCGTCCRKGGPALHHQDRELITAGHLTFPQLITIRAGEFAHNPISDKSEPVKQELIKLAGRGREWACCFLGSDDACTLYQHRPQECRLLQCWDTAAICAVIGQDYLTREHLIRPDDPLLKLVRQHERECPWGALAELTSRTTDKKEDSARLSGLSRLINRDLEIRRRAVVEFKLGVAVELFVFGRPIFTALAALGLHIQETPDGNIMVSRAN